MGDYLTFGSVNSSTYGVYIFGESTYDAPQRDVETITIPGRNGVFMLDNNRFENIEVTYMCYAYANTRAALTTTLDGFRNALKSQIGYQRLTDTFHTDEYRMGALIDDIEIDPILYNTSAKFRLKFNCKPQRFLTSGETATSVANNGTITNPTLFDAHPLLSFNSSGADGTINLGSQPIKVLSAIVGTIPLNLTKTSTTVSGYLFADSITINNTASYNTGDTITFSGASAYFYWTGGVNPSGSGYSNNNGFATATANVTYSSMSLTLKARDTTFTAGTSSTVSKTIDVTLKSTGGTAETKTVTLELVYNGSNTVVVRWKVGTFTNFNLRNYADEGSYSGTVDSSKNTLQNVAIYIDLDIGEAYSIDSNNNVVSLNNYVNLGGELPVLPSGSTTITYSNTISNFKITPRWWRV